MNDQERADEYSYIERDLEELNRAEILLDDLAAEKTSRYDDLITDDVRQGMVEIDDELDGGIAAAETKVVQLRAIIREDVLEIKTTVQSKYLMAVWNKGRVSWDTAALKGYAVTHPEVNQLRKTGKPSVTIRKVK